MLGASPLLPISIDDQSRWGAYSTTRPTCENKSNSKSKRDGVSGAKPPREQRVERRGSHLCHQADRPPTRHFARQRKQGQQQQHTNSTNSTTTTEQQQATSNNAATMPSHFGMTAGACARRVRGVSECVGVRRSPLKPLSNAFPHPASFLTPQPTLPATTSQPYPPHCL